MKVPQKMPLFLYYIRRKSLTERKMGDILLKVNPQYFARDWKKSIRGASGGYVLARDASEISVGDVLRALEGNLEPVRCAAFYSEEGCMASDECVTKYVWQKINDSINKTVNEIKLDELVKESKELNPEGVIHGECSQQ